jgi:hypothetical protein
VGIYGEAEMFDRRFKSLMLIVRMTLLMTVFVMLVAIGIGALGV